jgi:serine/threonine-protein kinase
VAIDEELHREVALKEIQDRHADNPASRSRFLLEAEITGGLEHPGIVPVYSLGQYADGRPFYAMRFIRGHSMQEAIDGYHKSSRSDSAAGRSDEGAGVLELRKLLGRFIDVCEAIQYAHDRGVLHRDLKPSNIMLGKYGETLVVDWGLAKLAHPGASAAASADDEPALHPAFATGSAETAAGSAVGTPSFMSPEQAAGRLDQLGPASDVYSLGATLYCLLTGQAPMDGADVASMLTKVRAGNLPRPRQVKPDLEPALEAICLKAMALQPMDRYPTPRALAGDLEHWLADRPVSAWPEPWRVKARRWLSGHKTLVSGIAAALCVGLVSLLIATLLLSKANEQLLIESGKVQKVNEKLAEESEQTKRHARRAEQNFGKARQAVARLTQVAKEKLGHLPRMEQEQRAIFQEARTFFEELPAEELRDPSIQNDLGKLYGLLGNVELRFGNLDRAEDLFGKQLTIQKRLAADIPAPEHTQEWAQSLIDLADLYNQMGLHKKAESTHREAILLREKLATENPQKAVYQAERATEYYNLALVLMDAGQNQEAEASYRQALLLLEELADAPGVQAKVQDDLSAAHLSLGAVQQQVGNYVEAEQSYQRALACKDKLAHLDPDRAARPYVRLELRRTYQRLGAVLRLTGKPAEAEKAYRAGLDVAKKLANDFPTVPDFYLELGKSYAALAALLAETGQPTAEFNKLALEHWRRFPELLQSKALHPPEEAVLWDSWARRLLQAGDYQEAEKYFRQTLPLSQKLHDQSPALPRYRRALAFAWSNIGITLENQGKIEDAESAYRQSIELHERFAEDFSYWPDGHVGLAEARRFLMRLLVRRGQTENAEALLCRNVALWDTLLNDFPEVPSYREERGHELGGLASQLDRSGRVEEAEKVHRQQLAAFEGLAADFPGVPSYRRNVAIVLSNLANELQSQGRTDEAERGQRRALALRAKLVEELPVMPLHRTHLGQSYTNLGILLAESNRPAMAETELLNARRIFQELHGRFVDNVDYASELAATCNTLGNTWRALRQPLKAKASWQEALELQKKMVADKPDEPDFRLELAMSHNNLGLLLEHDLKQIKDAAQAYRAGIEILAALAGQYPKTVRYQAALGEAHGQLGRLLLEDKSFSEARAHLDQSVRRLRQALQVNPLQSRYGALWRQNAQSWVAVLVLTDDDAAAVKAAADVAAWFPQKNEGAFLAAKGLCMGMSEIDGNGSLTAKERSRRLNLLGEQALALLQKTPPTVSAHIQEMKETAVFQVLRRRDDFKSFLDNLKP